jgi:acetylornithine deacetylase/succinyl-diaminopimelate desuccinylase-like protein
MVTVAAGVAIGAPQQDAAGVDRAAGSVTADGILSHVKALAADDKEGRAPGTTGEERTVAYLVEQFKRLGLKPGNPDGTYVQRVPLTAFMGRPEGWFDVKGTRMPIVFPDEAVAVARQGLPEVSVANSEMVFVGYGVVAPEIGWDDFKGVDVRGKTLVMLVGDPPVPDPGDPSKLDPKTFGGAAMTYYGRWTYKYEIAAKKGAAAAILIHETGPAGYPYDVVRGSWGRENFGLDAPGEADRHARVDMWITLDRAKALLAACGLDVDTLKSRAVSRQFVPVPLGATATLTVTNTVRKIASQNVMARLEGSDPLLRNEFVMYSAHWDSFGRNASLAGDQIFNGALDNGSGMATMLAMAEAFTKLPVPPKRSLLFLAPTAEESAMLGAKYYASHPLWPLARTVADINMDIMNFWGRTRAIVSIRFGMTTLDEVLAAEAAKQDRVVLPDPESEKGYFYRSDHFEFAKLGVPALHFLHPGAEYRGKPADYGQQMRDRYTTQGYHKVTDEVRDDWDLSGAVEDAVLLFRTGFDVAQGPARPLWKPGTEFRAVQEELLKTPPREIASSVREYRLAHETAIVGELTALLALPNIAADAADMHRNAAALKAMLERRGVGVRFLEVKDRGPIIIGSLPAPGATRTLVFYAHYDGQHVDASAWTGTKPFEPALRTASIAAGGQLRPFPAAGTPYEDDWRIYGRSASDDKSPIVAMLAAIDALAGRGIPRTVNLKFVLDSEEEAGSPGLTQVIPGHAALVAGDVLITGDGPVHATGRPLVFFGNRGILEFQLTVYGPVRGLHSGHYGNWAPNPAMRLSQLLASMKGPDGRVLVAGFYDDVVALSDREKAAIAAMPNVDADLIRELQFGEPDGGGRTLADLIGEPSLNIRGLRSAYVGDQSQNVVPEKAEASIDVRLVKDVQPTRQFDRIVAHIEKQGYFVVRDRAPTADERRAHARVVRVDYGGGYPATRTSMDLPVSVAITRAIGDAFGDVVRQPTLGGSAPMHIFSGLGMPVVGVPIVNYDNSQHAQDENLRIGHFWRGIETCAVLLAGLSW